MRNPPLEDKPQTDEKTFDRWVNNLVSDIFENAVVDLYIHIVIYKIYGIGGPKFNPATLETEQSQEIDEIFEPLNDLSGDIEPDDTTEPQKPAGEISVPSLTKDDETSEPDENPSKTDLTLEDIRRSSDAAARWLDRMIRRNEEIEIPDRSCVQINSSTNENVSHEQISESYAYGVTTDDDVTTTRYMIKTTTITTQVYRTTTVLNFEGPKDPIDNQVEETEEAQIPEPPEDVKQLEEMPPDILDEENRKYLTVADIRWSANAAARWVHRVLLKRLKLDDETPENEDQTDGPTRESKPLWLLEPLEDPSDSPDFAQFGLFGLPSGPDDGENLHRRTRERLEILEPKIDAVRESNTRCFYRFNIDEIFGSDHEQLSKNPLDTFQCSEFVTPGSKNFDNDEKDEELDKENKMFKSEPFERWVNVLQWRIIETALTTFYYRTITETYTLHPGTCTGEKYIQSFTIQDEPLMTQLSEPSEKKTEIDDATSPLDSIIVEEKLEIPSDDIPEGLESAPVPTEVWKSDYPEIKNLILEMSAGEDQCPKIENGEPINSNKRPETAQTQPQKSISGSETTFTLSEINLSSSAAAQWISRLFKEDEPPENDSITSNPADPEPNGNQKQVEKPVFLTTSENGSGVQVYAYEIPGLENTLTIDTIFAFILNVPFTNSVVQETDASIDIDQETVLKEEFDSILKQFPTLNEGKRPEKDVDKQESEQSKHDETTLDYDVIEIFVRRPERRDSTEIAQTFDDDMRQENETEIPGSVNEIIEIRFPSVDFDETTKIKLKRPSSLEKNEDRQQKISPWNQISEDADEARRNLSPMKKNYKSISDGEHPTEDLGTPGYPEIPCDIIGSGYDDPSEGKPETTPEDQGKTNSCNDKPLNLAGINLSSSAAAKWISRLFKEDEAAADDTLMSRLVEPDTSEAQNEVELSDISDGVLKLDFGREPDQQSRTQVYAYDIHGLENDITVETMFTFVLNVPFTNSVVQQTDACIDIDPEVVLKEKFDSILKQFPRIEGEKSYNENIDQESGTKTLDDKFSLEFEAIEIFVRRPARCNAIENPERDRDEALESQNDPPENVNEIIEIRFGLPGFHAEELKPKADYELPKEDLVAPETEGVNVEINGDVAPQAGTPKNDGPSRKSSKSGNELSLKDTQRVAKAAAKWVEKLLKPEDEEKSDKDDKFGAKSLPGITDKVEETALEPDLDKQKSQVLKSELPSVNFKTDETPGVIPDKTDEPETKESLPEVSEKSSDEPTQTFQRVDDKHVPKPDTDINETSENVPDELNERAEDDGKTSYTLRITERVATAAAKWLDRLIEKENGDSVLNEKQEGPSDKGMLNKTETDEIPDKISSEVNEDDNDEDYRLSQKEVKNTEPKPEEWITCELLDDAETGAEDAINYYMILSLEPWETYYAKKEREMVNENIQIYTPREKFEVESVQPISFASLITDLEERRKLSNNQKSTEKCLTENTQTEQKFDREHTDKKLEDERNSNAFRFCRFFGVHNVVEAPTKLRPGTVYFGSVENLVPDKTDEEPSFKVKKEVGPNEPLDVFYFCKDPSLPRFPSGNNILEVDFTVIRAKPVNPSGPSESDNETPHHLSGTRM